MIRTYAIDTTRTVLVRDDHLFVMDRCPSMDDHKLGARAMEAPIQGGLDRVERTSRGKRARRVCWWANGSVDRRPGDA